MSWHHCFSNLFRRDVLDREIDDELTTHIAERADELVEQGMSERDALDYARRQFGNYTRRKEDMKAIHLLHWLETVLQDMRYAFRTLRSNPAFAATAVLSLALGIGANTAIFSIINAVMLRSLPVEDPAKLVQIGSKEIGSELTNPIWEYLRDHQRGLSGALAYSPDRFDLSDGGESRFTPGMWVSGDFFGVLGVPALQGRVFTKQEDRRGAAPVAVVSYGFWKRNFPNDPDVIGKTIHLNRHEFEIVGVTPPWFTGLEADRVYDVAIPISCEPILHTDRSALDNRSWWWLRILGRLSPGENLQQAQSRLKALTPAMFQETVDPRLPAEGQKEFVKSTLFLQPATTGFSDIRTQYKTALFTLIVITGLVLLVACANIANLLLARATSRQREFSVRLAMGASRLRVVRQLMTESILLSLAGAGAGLLLALWMSRLLVRLISTTGNQLEINLSPNFTLLGFAILAAITTALLFGLAPALRATRGGLNHALKQNARGALHGSSRFNFGKSLVAGQVALSLILLVGAGLFLGTLRNLLTVNPGFSPHSILLVSAQFKQSSIRQDQRTQKYNEMLERIRTIPGVISAARSMRTPITNFGMNGLTYPEGYQAKSRTDTLVWLNPISPGYFNTMATRLVMGRDFASTDDVKAPKVMIIGESTARHFFGAANPIGKTIGMDTRGDKRVNYQVVGLVADTKYQRIDEGLRLTAFLSIDQDLEPDSSVNFEIRRAVPMDRLTYPVRSAISGVNRDVSLEFRDFENQVSESLVQPRVVALLSSAFGLLALLLAGIGLYGLTTYGVSRRKNEIGIRIALGARRGSVIWLVLRDVAVLLSLGVLAGVAASLAMGRLITTLLYGIRPNDPSEIGAAVLILTACTAFAAYIPARRAARMDPMRALREE